MGVQVELLTVPTASPTVACGVRDVRVAVMVPAADAIILDSTSLTPEEVLERMEREVRRC